jgi:hypothetical protein
MFKKFKGIHFSFVAALFLFAAMQAQAQQPEWIYNTLKGYLS